MTTLEFLAEMRRLGIELWAEGGKLRYRAPRGALPPALRDELVQRKAEILTFLAPAAGLAKVPPVEPVARAEGTPTGGLPQERLPQEGLPLSFAQQRLWFLAELEPASAAYNIPTFLRLTGGLDVRAVMRALDEILRRHQVLRTTYAVVEGEPVQVVASTVSLPLPLIDLGALPRPRRQVELRRRLLAEARRPFELERGPIARAGLLRLDATEHVFTLTVHHIAFDGWSQGVLSSELVALYEAFRRGLPSPLPEPPVQYSDFAAWQRRWRSAEVLADQLAYWREHLAGAPRRLELPTDRRRPAVLSSRGAMLPVAFSDAVTAALSELSRRRGATLFMTLLAAFQVLLGRLSGQRDIVVGSPVAGRQRPEVEGLIGCFVNTLVLRADLSLDQRFGELLQQDRRTALGAYAHQDLPFEKLVQELSLQRDLGQNPLFQVMFTLQNLPVPEVEISGLRLTPLEIHPPTAMFDLTLTLYESAAGLAGHLEYSTDLFDATTIRRWAGHLETLLAGIVADPERRLCELPLLSPAEERQLVVEWNDTAVPVADETPVHRLFELQAARSPEAVALERDGEFVSYRELDRRAGRLARRLRAAGPGPEVLVGVCLERSAEMVTALLGVWKAGGVFVPLDPDSPAERLAFMVEDTGISALVTRGELVARLRKPLSATLVLLDGETETSSRRPAAIPTSDVDGRNLAYVIYTSGSTGRPKGVAVCHQALAGHCRAVRRRFRLAAGDRVLQFTPFHFDVALEQVLPALLAGARLILTGADLWLPHQLLARFADHGVTVADLPAGYWREWVATDGALDSGGLPRLALRLLTVGGERMPADAARRWVQAATGAELLNAYGPTEATITATVFEISAGHGADTVPIGGPLAGRRLHVLDRRGRPAPVGVAGELHLGGSSLARGYLNRPRRTAERFVPDPWSARPGARLYRTGDLARYLPGGDVEFLRRIDRQVKVRGYRIEPGEVESALDQHPAVHRSLVLTGEQLSADPSGKHPAAGALVAYLVPAERDRGLPSEQGLGGELRDFLRRRLPEHMIPSSFVEIAELPLAPFGEVDRAALEALPAAAETARPEAAAPPRTELEEALADIWRRVLDRSAVGIHQNFFDLGGHSLLVVRVVGELRQVVGREVSVLEMFEHPTIASLARALSPEPATPAQPQPATAPVAGGEIAIVGMAGRFPGARDLAGLWRNLAAGVESITAFTPEEMAAAGVDRQTFEHPDYVSAGTVFDDPDLFDAAFFEIGAREAQIIDPQQRIFLEVAWEALEDAACDPERYEGAIGVYAGASFSSYLLTNLLTNPALAGGQVSAFEVAVANEKDYLTTRLSYRLNLRGPSVNVNTACSTSLVAVHLACRSLQGGECDVALAGGATITFPQRTGYLHEPDGILSADGHCRAFDARASGTVPGQGVAVVVLRRLEDALAAGDPIRAVIKGSAINNDGSAKIGFTAPSVGCQAAVISRAQELAGVAPETVSYVETHGTATALGDPVEIRALTRAFGAVEGAGFCALGSVKTNIGHLDSAAGVAGLVKTVLALERRQIPPSLHFEEPNPEIDFAAGPFYVAAELAEWPSDGTPRRAGVSSFGIGGTNAHVVLEEAPEPAAPSPGRPWQLLVLSARTPAALDAATADLRRHLAAHPELEPADVAFTLGAGRRAFEHRRAVVCRDLEAAAALETPDRPPVVSGRCKTADPPLAMLFPGQGAQHVDMGRELYDSEPVFRRHVDRCCEILEPNLGLDLRAVLYPSAEERETAAAELRRTALAQPALFTVELALAQLWREWGVRPVAMLGHSIGEYVAASVAGVLSLEDALVLVAERGRLMQRTGAGAMLEVGLPEEEVVALLRPGLELAAVNAPARSVVSGPADAVAALARELAAESVRCRPLRTSHAFHSALMEPALATFEEAVRRVRLSPPKIPFVSNLTGTWIRDQEATDPRYWARHLRSKVRFSAGLAELLRHHRLLLEVGPGTTLSTLAREQAAAGAEPGPTVLASLPHLRDRRSSLASLLSAAGRLWLAGVALDWAGIHGGRRRRVRLPSYPFERRRYWIEPGEGGPSAASLARKSDVGEWFYWPSWHRSPPLDDRPAAGSGPWLVWASQTPLGVRLAERLAEDGREVVTVRPGERFERLPDGGYGLDPRRAEDYDALVADLRQRDKVPAVVAHLWTLTEPAAGELAGEPCARMQDLGFYSLLFLAQALGRHGLSDPLRIEVVSNQLHEVTGGESVAPEKVTVLGPCKVIPQELSGVACRSIDVELPAPGSAGEDRLVDQLSTELASAPADPVVAYRGVHRWLQRYQARVLAAGGEPPRRLRRGGVYLVTGGLGGLGLVVARYLAAAAGARLALVGRSALPERGDWQHWLAEHGEEEAVSRKIRAVLDLEAGGAEVLTLAADVADREAMARAVAEAGERFGEIHGVIHAAGVAGGGLIALRSRREAERVMRPKVSGGLALEAIFRDAELDFMLLFSSLNAIDGGVGQVDYCAANLFLDALAQRLSAGGRPTVAIDWDAWREVGMAVDAGGQGARRLEGPLQHGIDNAEGEAAIGRILSHDTGPQVLVSTRDLEAVLAHSREINLAGALEALDRRRRAGDPGSPGEGYPRPELETPYAEPRGETEGAVAELWQEVLFLERVGRDDSFFEIGGDSLIATQLTSRLRDAFGVEMGLERFFDQPTVAGLAREIETVRWARETAAAATRVAADETEEGEL